MTATLNYTSEWTPRWGHSEESPYSTPHISATASIEATWARPEDSWVVIVAPGRMGGFNQPIVIISGKGVLVNRVEYDLVRVGMSDRDGTGNTTRRTDGKDSANNKPMANRMEPVLAQALHEHPGLLLAEATTVAAVDTSEMVSAKVNALAATVADVDGLRRRIADGGMSLRTVDTGPYCWYGPRKAEVPFKNSGVNGLGVVIGEYVSEEGTVEGYLISDNMHSHSPILVTEVHPADAESRDYNHILQLRLHNHERGPGWWRGR